MNYIYDPHEDEICVNNEITTVFISNHFKEEDEDAQVEPTLEKTLDTSTLLKLGISHFDSFDR